MSSFRRFLLLLGLPLLSLLTTRGLADAEVVPPTLEAIFPESGFVFSLSQVEVHFSEAVQESMLETFESTALRRPP